MKNNPTETLTLNHANGASIGLEYSGTENGTINVNSAAMYVRAGTENFNTWKRWWRKTL